MNNAASYPYATGDLIGAPASYGYSRYAGEVFLDAWKQQRSRALRDFGGESAAKEPCWPPCGAPKEPPFEALPLFSRLARGMLDEEGRDEALATLRVLLKRFEVTKRVYAAYDQEFRAADKHLYREMGLYAAFAALLESAYALTGKLPFLNGLLKILDTLCAHGQELEDRDRALVAWLILREARHAEALGRSAGARP